MTIEMYFKLSDAQIIGLESDLFPKPFSRDDDFRFRLKNILEMEKVFYTSYGVILEV